MVDLSNLTLVNCIIKKVKFNYWKCTHKYVCEHPKSVLEALAIDQQMETDFWYLAIKKEMHNIMPAFEFCDNDKMPVRYKHFYCQMIFDIKFDLTKEAQFVAVSHQTNEPKNLTFSSLVSYDSIHIAFTLAALNNLDILSVDVQNAYLNVPVKEKFIP